MARPYAREMAKLAETFAWAAAADLQPWRQAVRTAGLSPFRAIGAGGSHSTGNPTDRSDSSLFLFATLLRRRADEGALGEDRDWVFR